MDSIDLAQQAQSNFVQSCLNTHKSMYKEKQLYDEDGDVICKLCEEKIDKRRLKAIPDAVYCVDCANELSNS